MKIENSKKIKIAKDFIALHKHGVDAWSPTNLHGDEKYLHIYSKLINGVYGGTEYTESEKGYPCIEVEISKFDSISGCTHVFEIALENQQTK